MARGRNGPTKEQWLADEVAKAVGAGKTVALETVDFSDPDRPPTCLEVDFPILPINQIAAIEGNAGKPIYQVSKWWARRRSSVFRSMLLAAATKAPEDPAEASKLIWDAYYKNHQKKGALSHLKVADIFMGGGTTIVEGSRLGMQMYGTDLNPVAWFVVKTEMAQVQREEVEALLADVEAEVKPQIMPFYACECPRGHKGKWTRVSTGEVMGEDFDPLALTVEERPDYAYEGPEIIYVFWAKHGPCQVTGCGHRTPIMSKPLMAVKTITVKAWDHRCQGCGDHYDIEEQDARMAPGVPLVIAGTERPFAVQGKRLDVTCPLCGHYENMPGRSGKAKKKKIELSLLVHPAWLAGESKTGPDGRDFGGSVTDSAEATAAWNRARAKRMRLVEVRGALPNEVTCQVTGTTIATGKEGGTVPRKSHYACGSCGTVQDVLMTIKVTGKTGPVAAYAVQGYCPSCDREKQEYRGRFFAPVDASSAFDAAAREWEERRESDLANYWPKSKLPYGFMTHTLNGGIPNHGFTHWWTMFNPRQLLVQSQLLRTIVSTGNHSWEIREYVLAAYQQYLRNQNMFCFWNPQRDTSEPMFSNANFHPKSTVIENCVFAGYGRGNWQSSSACLVDASGWSLAPWDLVANHRLGQQAPELAADLKGKSSKVRPHDPVRNGQTLECRSATELATVAEASYDLVVTDPPFGGLLHYSELSDFFYVWLRLVLEDQYPDIFGPKYTPKTLEAVANRAREPEDPDGYYQRLLTASWREAHRILKPGGLLAFTFHHSEDAPWVSVLESLFDAGFYLEATYPIRSDEIKGKGEFGSRKIEFDIIHVCRKRRGEPSAVSWAKMRREVLRDVRRLKNLLEQHKQEGLPAADLQVIRRGKALEYFSRHYGKVLVNDEEPMSVKDALLGINQLLDEESGQVSNPPPATAAPFTRQFLRLFDGQPRLPQNQMINHLRGTGYAPSDFVSRGWCTHDRKTKTYEIVPAIEIARVWHGKHRQGMVQDYDQAAFLIGACIEGSGINASETLSNDRFKPHAALGSLLDWFTSHGADTESKIAADRAAKLLRAWRERNRAKAQQMDLDFGDGEAD
jgi:adenine-specific DNA methylase